MRIKDMSSEQLEEAVDAISELIDRLNNEGLENWRFAVSARAQKDAITREIDRRAMRNSEYRR